MLLIFYKLLNKLSLSLLCLVLFLPACELLWNPNTPTNYTLRRPVQMFIEKKLNEISGIFYLKKENHLIAIADDKKKIYSLATNGQVTDYYDPELPSEDFEDVVKVDSIVYTLISNGTIVAISKNDTGLVSTEYPFWGTGKNDFETLYYDSTANGLIILCKSCEVDKGKKLRNAFRFDISTRQFDKTPFYGIKIKEVADVLKDGKVEFKPSAAAIHPLTNKLYILASSGNLLIIADKMGKVEDVFRLNPSIYPQAEGIAFAPNGDMFISNEAKLGKPSLLKLAIKHKGK